jgi:uncharacterized protein YjdB
MAFSFKSNNSTICNVRSNGEVSANSNGSTTVTVTYSDNINTISKDVTFVVKTVAQSVSFNGGNTTSLTIGGSKQLSVTVLPNDASDKNVDYKLQNDNGVLSLSESNNLATITAKKAGQEVVVASVNTTPNKTITAKLTVTVTAPVTQPPTEPPTIDPSSSPEPSSSPG